MDHSLIIAYLGVFLLASVLIYNPPKIYPDQVCDLPMEKNVEVDKGINLEEKNKVYQGPVPEGYDEQYFRETGITKLLEVDK